MRDTFAAFSERNYRLLWSGSLFSTTAFMMSFMLVPSVAYEISGNNTAAGIAQLGSGISMFLVAPIGGVVADRLRKKRIVLTGQTIPGLIILLIGIFILNDWITIPLLTLGTLIMGLGFAFMGPARQAWVGELVPGPLLPNAVALQQISQNIAQVAGPLMIGILVGSWVGIGGTYIFMAALFVIVLPLTSRLPDTKPSTPRDQRRSVSVELSAGVHYVARDRQLRVLWAGFVAIVVSGFAFQTLIPGLLDQELGREPTDIGLIFLSFAIAGLVVNIPLANLVRTRWAWPAMIFMGVLMAVGFGLLSVAPTYALGLLCGVPLGIGRSGFMLLDNSLLMSNSNPAFFGRVMSLTMMAFGAQALLAPIWGSLADAIGIRETMAIVGLVALVAMALMTLAWLRMRGSIRPIAEVQRAFITAEQESEPRPTTDSGPPTRSPHPQARPRTLSPAPSRPALTVRAQAQVAAPESLTPPFWRSALAGAVALGMALGLAAAQRTTADDTPNNARRPKWPPASRPRSEIEGARHRLADWLDPPT